MQLLSAVPLTNVMPMLPQLPVGSGGSQKAQHQQQDGGVIRGVKVSCCMCLAWQFQPRCGVYRLFHLPRVQHPLTGCIKCIEFCLVSRKIIVTTGIIEGGCGKVCTHVGCGEGHALVAIILFVGMCIIVVGDVEGCRWRSSVIVIDVQVHGIEGVNILKKFFIKFFPLLHNSRGECWVVIIR